MDHPFQKVGHYLSENPTIAAHSRRGFIATTAAALASCKAVPGINGETATTASVNPASNASANRSSRSYSSRGPVPQNQVGNHSSNFSKNAGLTFTRVMVSGNHIAMTYDDGPHPSNTPRLLDMLAARNIKATFYVIGNSVNQNPGVLRRTVSEGHEIGNHTQTHPLLTKLGDSQVRQEMQRCIDAIGNAAGVRPRTMRPPYGGLLQRQRELVLNEFGYPTILWSVDPLDWKKPGPSVVANRIISGTSAGGIVLAHDLHSQTVDAMPQALDGLLRKGFKFVTVSQLIAMQVASAPASTPASTTP